MEKRCVLVGNPNAGKTTLFNALTGSRQQVGNWPGVTVEKKEGKVQFGGCAALLTDLPGIYSLSPHSMEERLARDVLLASPPDLIINIVDATNLERNLYLTLQLAEMEIPMLIALNFMDALGKEGKRLDVSRLSRLLGLPVCSISAGKGWGLEELRAQAESLLLFGQGEKGSLPPALRTLYSAPTLRLLRQVEELSRQVCRKNALPLRWTALRLVEGDGEERDRLLTPAQRGELEFLLLQMLSGRRDGVLLVAGEKYRFLKEVCREVLSPRREEQALTPSDRIDQILTHRYLAIPIFLAVMFSVFFLTFGIAGSGVTDWLQRGMAQVVEMVRLFLQSLAVKEWAVGMVCDGILAGVSSILQFFPQICILFFFLSLLEGSGYMARAAFVMDRLFARLGLSGRSFVPLLMGFGCTVPAVMACRGLQSVQDKRMTILMTPYLSCSAKMPVYSLLCAAFFPKSQALVLFFLYLLGGAVAVGSALLLQKTAVRKSPADFVMELPPYRMPSLKNLRIHLGQRVGDFFGKAGKLLLVASLLIWALQYFDFSLHHAVNNAQSMLGQIGTFLLPAFQPLGFGTWEGTVAMLSGLAARETIVSTLGILYGTGGGGLIAALQSAFSPLEALCFMTFTLLFLPCIAALSTIKNEMKSWRWTVGSMLYQCVTAWVVTFAVYQFGSLALHFVGRL